MKDRVDNSLGIVTLMSRNKREGGENAKWEGGENAKCEFEIKFPNCPEI